MPNNSNGTQPLEVTIKGHPLDIDHFGGVLGMPTQPGQTATPPNPAIPGYRFPAMTTGWNPRAGFPLGQLVNTEAVPDASALIPPTTTDQQPAAAGPTDQAGAAVAPQAAPTNAAQPPLGTIPTAGPQAPVAAPPLQELTPVQAIPGVRSAGIPATSDQTATVWGGLPTANLGRIPSTAPADVAQQTAARTPIQRMPTPATIPPESTGRRILDVLGKIGGTALSAMAPGIAAWIPQTPLGKIAAEERGMEREKLSMEEMKAQAEAATARGQLQIQQATLPYTIQSMQAEARSKIAQADLEADPVQKEKLYADAAKARADAADATVKASKGALELQWMQGAGAGAYDSIVDAAIPPGPQGEFAQLNKSIKAEVDAARKMGDLKAAQEAIGRGISQMQTALTEQDPKIIQARGQTQAIAQQAIARVFQGGGPWAGVEPAMARQGMEQLNKYTSNLGTVTGQLDVVRQELQQAKNGNEVASALAPVALLLGQNAFYGTHRFSPTEQDVQQGLGSAYRQFNQWMDKIGSGTINEATRKEMGGILDDLAKGAGGQFRANVTFMNRNYGSTVDPDAYLRDLGLGGTAAPGGGGGAGTPERPKGVPDNYVFNPSVRRWQPPKAQ